MVKLSRAIFLIVLIFSISNVSAQERVKIKKKEFNKTDQTEGFKEAWKQIKLGDKYYEQGIGTFNLARDHYLFANNYNGYNAELNYKIGLCYLFADDKFKAIDYFLKAYELKPDVSPEIKFLIGRAYHQVLEFDKARQFYQEYKEDLPPDEDLLVLANKIEKLIVECTNGKTLVQNPKRVIIKNLGENINSAYDEYNPNFAYQDTALFFTSRRPDKKKSKRSKVDNKYMENIYISGVNKNEFEASEKLGKPFIDKGNISIISVAPDGRSVLIYDGSENGGDIMQVFYNEEKGKWKKPKSLSKYVSMKSMETSAALSPGGTELYFVSDNSELTNGGKDIFISRMNAKGKWDEPLNLGRLINSRYDEEGVFLSKDGRTMYFSSKGHNSMGGFDIFKSELVGEGRWSAPENLGFPINTPEDEVFYVTDESGVNGYYSTIREGGYGEKDIYRVVTLGSEKELITLTKEKLSAMDDYLEIDPFLTIPSKLSLDTSIYLKGMVRDTMNGADTTVLARLQFMDPGSGNIVANAMTGNDGYYRTRLPEAKVYGVEINATGYLYYLDILDLSKIDRENPPLIDFYLQPIEIGTKVVLENIYFQTGKSILTPNSYDALDQVARFLENNRSVRLEISGHTDNTGSVRFNKALSEARARAVVNYLINHGVSAERLEYKGYADEQPVADNSTEEGREMNRRVEFKILSK